MDVKYTYKDIIYKDTMNKELVYHLPLDVKSHILSYLYFSYPLSKSIELVNESIKKYKMNQLYDLRLKYNVKTINYFILKYFLYDKFNSEKHNLDYDIMETSYHCHYAQMLRVFKLLTLRDVCRLYNFICRRGGASDTFRFK